VATFLQEKNGVSGILGRTDGATPNVIRDNAINDVRQNEIANAYPFSWLRKKTTVITGATGLADLPADFNINHKIYDIRIANSGNDDIFSEIDSIGFDSLTSNVYFIDYNTTTKVWQINTHNNSITITIVYYHIPATLTADADVDIIPDQDVIAMLAGARYWLSSERDETNHDRFKALGERKLQLLINKDKKAQPLRRTRSTMFGVDMGFNR